MSIIHEDSTEKFFQQEHDEKDVEQIQDLHDEISVGILPVKPTFRFKDVTEIRLILLNDLLVKRRMTYFNMKFLWL